MEKDGTFELDWIDPRSRTGLGATYEDAQGRPCTSECHEDLNTFEPGANLGEWTEIKKHWEDPECFFE